MSDQVQYVSQSDVEALLIRLKGAKALGLVALTVPSCFSAREGGSRKATAAVCPPVMKQQHVVGMTGFEYERSRNNDNQRVWGRQIADLRAEGKNDEADVLEATPPEPYEVKGRSDSRERIQGTPLVRNAEGHLYVVMMIPTGNHPDWRSGRGDTSYCYLPEHRELLLSHYAKYGPKAAAEAYPEEVLAKTPAVEYSLEADQDNSLASWLKPYKRSDKDPVDFDYREYRTDHLLEIRHEGVRYIIGQPPAAEAVA